MGQIRFFATSLGLDLSDALAPATHTPESRGSSRTTIRGFEDEPSPVDPILRDLNGSALDVPFVSGPPYGMGC